MSSIRSIDMCSLCPHCACVRAFLASVSTTVRGVLPKDDKQIQKMRGPNAEDVSQFLGFQGRFNSNETQTV